MENAKIPDAYDAFRIFTRHAVPANTIFAVL